MAISFCKNLQFIIWTSNNYLLLSYNITNPFVFICAAYGANQNASKPESKPGSKAKQKRDGADHNANGEMTQKMAQSQMAVGEMLDLDADNQGRNSVNANNNDIQMQQESNDPNKNSKLKQKGANQLGKKGRQNFDENSAQDE